jgi:T-complex protein 1 subunit gamma
VRAAAARADTRPPPLSADVLSEVERNLHDAMTAVRNILLDPRVLPGGGATEMAVATAIRHHAKQIGGVQQWPFKSLADALEIIPKTLIENCGGKAIKALTELRAKHATGNNEWWGIDGIKGEPAHMGELGIVEPFAVKSQSIKTAVEAACMLLRIDDIVSGISKKGGGGGKPGAAPEEEQDDTFGDMRDG